MSKLNVSNLFNENEDGAPVVSGISTFSSPNYFVPPSGSTEQRPSNPGEGMIRFNTDSGHLEYYTGTHWADVITNNNELGDQNNTNSSGGTGIRGLFGGGAVPGGNTNTIEYVSISTLGDAQNFGDLATVRAELGSFASSTRGVWAGGQNPGVKEEIEFVTIASTGTCEDFGNIQSSNKKEIATFSSETRGFIAGSGTNTITYVEIASKSNDIDFGDLPDTDTSASYGVASRVRGVVAGGNMVNRICYVTMSTLGNARDFGDLTDARYAAGAFSNPTRGVFGGGWSPNVTNVIDFITIASTGNARDFGDLTQAKYLASGCASSTRGLFWGGNRNPSPSVREIDTVEIMTTGNATDFGDLTGSVTAAGAACSNGHGGL